MNPDERNRRERERYQNDPAFRSRAIERTRRRRAELREEMKTNPALAAHIRRLALERQREYQARKAAKG